MIKLNADLMRIADQETDQRRGRIQAEAGWKKASANLDEMTKANKELVLRVESLQKELERGVRSWFFPL